MIDLGAMHRLYHICGYGGLRFELLWWQFEIVSRLLRLGGRWFDRASAALRALPPPKD